MNTGTPTRFPRRMLPLLLVLGLLGACDFNLSASDHLEQAREYLRQGDYQAGVIELKNALQKNGKLAEARWLLGNLYLRQGKAADAVKELSRARELGMDTDESLLALLRARLLLGEYQKVLDETGPLLASNPSADLLALRASAYLGLNKADQARKSYETALEHDENSIESLLGLARMSLAYKDYDGASGYITRVLEIDPKEPRAWLLKGGLEELRGEKEAAEAVYRKALELAPGNPMFEISLIRNLIGQDKLDEARKELSRLGPKVGNSLNAKYFKAYLAFRDKDPTTAKAELREILSVVGNHGPSMLLLGSILYQEGAYEQAEELLSRYVKGVPANLQARKLLAATRMRLDDPEGAIEVLEPVVEENTKIDAQTLALLGSAYLRAGKLDRGTELLQRAAELDPDAASIRAQLGLSHLASGKTEMAEKELEAAVELKDDLFQADLLLALTQLKKKDYEAAIRTGERLAQKMPDNPIPENMLGAAFLGLKDLALAREHFKKALKIKPDFTPALFNLAGLELLAGNRDRAIGHFQKILELQPDNLRAMMEMARLYYRAEQFDQALDYLHKAREAHPDALQPLLLLTRYYLRTGKPEEALKNVRKAVEADHGSPRSLLLEAEVEIALRHGKEALETLSRLPPELRDSPVAHFRAAQAQLIEGNRASAIDSLQAALKLKPDYAAASLLLARLEAESGDLRSAQERLHRLQEMSPRQAAPWLTEADLLLARKRHDDAIAVYRRAARAAESPLWANRIFQAYRAKGDAKAAERTLRDWTGKHPDDLRTSLVLASFLQNEGRHQEAIVIYRRVLEKNPDDTVALNNLAWSYYQSGDPRALETARKAWQQAPELVPVLDTYGWLLVEQGEVAQGRKLLEQAYKGNPQLPDLAYHLAAARIRDGDRRGGVALLEKTLRDHPDFETRTEAEALLRSSQG